MARSVFEPTSALEDFLQSPLKCVARYIHALILFLRGPAYRAARKQPPIRVVCISDTHNNTQILPDGDLLIHAGDLTSGGSIAEIQNQLDWLKQQPHPEKVVIAGNHDSFFDLKSRRKEDEARQPDWGHIHYLERSGLTLSFPNRANRQLHVYGAPEIPVCGGGSFAFQYPRLWDVWSNTIPKQIDVLITHTPPQYHLDLPAALGCKFLLSEVWRVRPTLHVFGHVHAGAGREAAYWDEGQRAYERIMTRKDGFYANAFDIFAWLQMVRLLYYGLQGIIWSRVWGGTNNGSILVNAALAYRNSGKLKNPVQVVDI